MTLTINVPETKVYDKQILQQQLTAFANILLSYAPHVNKAHVKEDMHIFDCFAGDWGGDRDSNDIAAELHANRVNTKTAETW